MSSTTMEMGMVGLGRMGANMVRRLARAGHRCAVYDRDPAPGQALATELPGTIAVPTPEALVAALPTPRAIWLMVPAAVVDATIELFAPHLAEGDILVDGGNSFYQDDIRRSAALAARGIRYVDTGTSGGIWGLERGYCLMIGGPADAVEHLGHIFRALAPGRGATPPTPGRQPGRAGTAEEGYLHCGPAGAGHFVKMVHNSIEYGLMAAYAEGFNLLRHANAGHEERPADAETAPMRHPEHYQYDFDLAEIAEVWRRGSVIPSWLLDLIADALSEDGHLEGFAGRVSDSGEGRWAVNAAIDVGSPVPVLSTALFERFSSRGEDLFADRMLSAMRHQFGGHQERHPS